MILKLAEDKDIKGLLKLGSIIIVQYLILSFVCDVFYSNIVIM